MTGTRADAAHAAGAVSQFTLLAKIDKGSKPGESRRGAYSSCPLLTGQGPMCRLSRRDGQLAGAGGLIRSGRLGDPIADHGAEQGNVRRTFARDGQGVQSCADTR